MNNAQEKELQESRIEQLTEFVEKAKRKKLSSDEVNSFNDLWLDVAIDLGITERIASLLFEGFAISKGFPAYKLSLEMRDRSTYEGLFSSEVVRPNKAESATKMALSLFAFELCKPSFDGSLDMLVDVMGRHGFNKGGKVRGTFKRELDSLLVSPLSGSGIEETAQINEDSARQLLLLMGKPLEEYANDQDKPEYMTAVAKKLYSWLRERSGVPGRQEGQEGQENQEVEEPMPAPKTPSVSESTTKVNGGAASKPSQKKSKTDELQEQTKHVRVSRAVDAAQDIAPQSPIDPTTTTLSMSRVLTFLESYEKGHARLVESVRQLEAECAEMRENAELQDRRLEVSKKNIESLRARLKEAEDKVSEGLDIIMKLQAENHSLRNDLKTAEELVKMAENQQVRKDDAASRKMARELSFEYKDFLGAETQEMSLDLGENMRDQLRNVFEILISNGLEL